MKERGMEKRSWIPELYGYTVCLIAVVVFLMSVNSVVDHAFDLANPIGSQAFEFATPSLTSFEAYRATYDQGPPVRERAPGAEEDEPPPTEDELRQRYEVLRADRIEQARFRAMRGLTTSGLMLIVSVALFLLHWRWLRKRAALAPTE